MPNYITNELTCERKETLDSLAGGPEEQFIDFEKLIPMPAMLKGDVDELTKDWAAVALGIANLNTLRQQHPNPGDSFRKGDYGSAAKVVTQWNLAKMLTEGPFPKDYDDERFEKLINCMRCLKQYGHASWYEWSIQNWGVKWNAGDQKRISDTVVRFTTAWAAPLKVLNALALRHPEEKFRLRWADEDTGSNAGDITVKGDQVVSGGRVENDSVEAHALAFDLCFDGQLPDDMAWKEGKLIYVEEAEAV